MFDLSDRIAVLVISAGIEAVVAYPAIAFRAIGHPVSWIGAIIDACDHRWNKPSMSFVARQLTGLATLIILLFVAIGTGLALEALARLAYWLGFGIAVLAVAILIAGGSLDLHVRAVVDALRHEGLDGGRKAISMIVGRDPDTLDEHALCRAAIESLAENASDGVTAPAFWYLVGGLPGMIAYKSINTADSMIGHRTERHRAFGWAAARLDDLVNLPASRLTAMMFIAAAAFVPGASAAAAWRAVRRGARHHRSPNAGWPEAAMAGALGLRLAGPRTYGGVRVDDHWMGDGRAEATPDDIQRALLIYRSAFVGTALLLAAIGALLMVR